MRVLLLKEVILEKPYKDGFIKDVEDEIGNRLIREGKAKEFGQGIVYQSKHNKHEQLVDDARAALLYKKFGAKWVTIFEEKYTQIGIKGVDEAYLTGNKAQDSKPPDISLTKSKEKRRFVPYISIIVIGLLILMAASLGLLISNIIPSTVTTVTAIGIINLVSVWIIVVLRSKGATNKIK